MANHNALEIKASWGNKKNLKEKTKCKERKQKEGNCTDFIQEMAAVACKPRAARNPKGFLILP